ncbi:hypothetical protein GP486_002337 [Trichoglossum hirsutum]|uniref:HNH nuclease domain-containing protein n=1 Tax=Trichoglossum hirsutum TaxID=265104 RepID=A0A9P8LFE5_9PEZI|nr:hypothetical protein GP486_002337 [Trichoglossum hirsutum]
MSRATVPRNVHFLDGENNEVLGFWQNGSVTWNQMAEWMHITITLPSTQFAVFRCLESGDPQDPVTNHGPSIDLPGNNDAVDPGYYALLSANGEPLDITITEERAIPRSISYNLSNPDPRWRSGQWSQRIEDDFPDVGDSKIHSVQNGILLLSHAHTYFDKYMIAINPDDNFKITSFVEDYLGFDGRYMAHSNYPQRYQPLRSLLKYHFRMAVLCNMKGRGPEYSWDEDIPPGMDPVAEISNSEEGKLRFELIMAERLNSFVE